MNWESKFAHRTLLTSRSPIREFVRYTRQPGFISFAGGLPAPDLFPIQSIREVTSEILRECGPGALQYAESEGLVELRDWIATRFDVERSNVLITNGAQQALDIIGRIFLEKGDTVLVENPTYLAALQAWRPWEVNLRALKRNQHGLDLENTPKLLYVIPNFQNPSGTTLSLTERVALTRITSETSTVLVEDDPYHELRFEGEELPSLLRLNRERSRPFGGNVLYTGSFSKFLAPGFRVGWLIGPEVVVEKATQFKQALDLHTSTLNQMAVLRLLKWAGLQEHIQMLRSEYRTRRDVMLEEVECFFPPGSLWRKPEGGMFLMVSLPPGFDARALLPEAIAAGVSFVPGQEFHLDNTGTNTLRLNFSNPAPAQIREGMGRLGRVLRKAFNSGKAYIQEPRVAGAA